MSIQPTPPALPRWSHVAPPAETMPSRHAPTPGRAPRNLAGRDAVPVQAKLAAAWTSLMFLYAYVDILGFYLPGTVDDILVGVVWEFRIDQVWATSALALMAIPILMVLLSLILPGRINRVTNLVVAALYVVVSATNILGESWTVYYGLALVLEVAVLALILRVAWTWPRAVAASVEPGVVAAG